MSAALEIVNDTDKFILYHLTTLKETKEKGEEDPTLYNSLYQLYNYYKTVGQVDQIHVAEFFNIAQIMLNHNYSDYQSDLGPCDFSTFLKEWIQEDFDDAYGGNGAYSIYCLRLNCLKKILRIIYHIV